MKLHRLFINNILDGFEVSITEENYVHQVIKVLRLKIGDVLVLLDNAGHSRKAVIEKAAKQSISCSLGEAVPSWKPKKEITLCPSIIKKDKMEWLVQKATELGVSRITPIISERTEKTGCDMRRLLAIAREASEQSERLTLPIIDEPISLDDALKNLDGKKVALDIVAKKGEEIFDADVFFVGPEGGWGEEDKKLFEKYNVSRLSLGENVLRAETASVALLSKIM